MSCHLDILSLRAILTLQGQRSVKSYIIRRPEKILSISNCSLSLCLQDSEYLGIHIFWESMATAPQMA